LSPGLMDCMTRRPISSRRQRTSRTRTHGRMGYRLTAPTSSTQQR
jgi:hypothetical protein